MASKVAWVGRTASMMFGLALILALIFGVTSAALSATGGNFVLGKANEATTVSRLTASVAGPALTLVNLSTDAAATALSINVASGKAPLKVNAAAGTATNLSADELDGKDSSEFLGKTEKAADATHADSATDAQNAATAATLGGKTASEFANAAHQHSGADINSGTVEADLVEDGPGSNLSADDLDGKDSSQFYAQGSKVADSAHADQADTATNATSATSAADADTLDGKDSSEFQPSNPCPSGTLFHEGACIEIAIRGSAAFPNAEAVCLQAERRLPTVAELQTFRLRGELDFDAAEYTSQAWTGAAGTPRPDMAMMVDPSGAQTPTSVFTRAAFRCVAPAMAAPPSETWEAAAQSDLRNAASAATACAADNDGSYASCGTAEQLSPYGFEKSPDVTYANLTATATRWVSAAQHNDGGSAYQFDSATGDTQSVPRF